MISEPRAMTGDTAQTSDTAQLSEVDRDWAWSVFEPSAERPWDLRLAAHLFRRAGFGGSSGQLMEALQSLPAEVVQEMVAAGTRDEVFEQQADALARTILASGDAQRLSAAWTYRLLHTPNQLLEKVTLFWHGHFATGAQKVQNAEMMWNQNQLLRAEALGDFAVLTQAIAQDPAMLVYLDSTTNRKSHPNENFARELMELFCLGEGNYTEADVQQLARCFTGWEIKNGKFRKNRFQQDRASKTVLGQVGKYDGEDGVRIVLEQPAMALFICRKLVRFFVCDEPELSDALLEPLAEQFRDSGLQLEPLVQRILSSNLFFSEHSVARKIRSPVELTVGLLRSLGGTTGAIQLAEGLAKIGQGLFFPPNVKGWDGGRAWINSSTLLGRANLIQQILKHESTRFQGASLAEFLSDSLDGLGLKSPSDTVQWLDGHLLAVPLSRATRQRLIEELESGGADSERRLRATVHTLATLPEFQLG